MTMIQILDEIVKYYSKDASRRAENIGGGCVYNTTDGRHCAVGRCLSSKFKSQGDNLLGNVGTYVHELASENKMGSLDEMLWPRYRGHSDKFWGELQTLHDDVDGQDYWANKTISKHGEKFVKQFKREIKKGVYNV